MTWSRFPLVGPAYADESRPWSSQSSVNYLLVPAEEEGTRSRGKLVGVPGLKAFSRGMQEAPVRGLHNVEGLLLAVAGDRLYRISPTAVAIPIGTVPGTGRVEMDHNQIQNGYEVMVANGDAGYVYNTRTGAYSQVTDPGFPGMRSPAFIDGYMAGIEPQGRFWFHSELRQAREYNTLDRYGAEARPDKLVRLVVSNREVLVLGESSGQLFRNQGGLTGTFQNSNGQEFQIGCASRYAAVPIENGVVFLGSDGLVYMYRGGAPQIISTGPIAAAMAQHDLSTCFCMTWEDKKHKVVYFTFPLGQTFGVDLWTGKWHQRQSYGMDRWRISALCKWGDRWIAGDYANGRLYELDWDVQAEYDQPLVRRRVTGAIHADENFVTVNALRIVADTGRPTIGAGEFPVPPVGPQIEGDAPNGVLGFPYAGFAYTVTEGDAPIASVTIVDGALPAGLTMDNAGVISATEPTAGGTFTITVRATDTNGLWAEVTDTIEIAEYFFAFMNKDQDGIWISEDISTDAWSDKWTLIPDESPDIHNLASVGGKLVIDAMIPGGERFYSAPLPPWIDNIPVSVAETPQTGSSLQPHRFCVAGGVIVAWEKNGNKTQYWTSDDSGVSWESHTGPDGLRLFGFARMDDGTWLCFARNGSTYGLYWSDEDVPVNWTQAAASGIGSEGSTNPLAGAEFGYFVDNLKRIWRTSSGQSWAQVGTLAGTLLNSPEAFVTSTGALVVTGGGSTGTAWVSRNNGVNFTTVTYAMSGDMGDLSEAGGYIVCESDSSDFVFYSDDDAASFKQSTPPISPGFGTTSRVVVLSLRSDEDE